MTPALDLWSVKPEKLLKTVTSTTTCKHRTCVLTLDQLQPSFFTAPPASLKCWSTDCFTSTSFFISTHFHVFFLSSDLQLFHVLFKHEVFKYHADEETCVLPTGSSWLKSSYSERNMSRSKGWCHRDQTRNIQHVFPVLKLLSCRREKTRLLTCEAGIDWAGSGARRVPGGPTSPLR